MSEYSKIASNHEEFRYEIRFLLFVFCTKQDTFKWQTKNKQPHMHAMLCFEPFDLIEFVFFLIQIAIEAGSIIGRFIYLMHSN